MNKNKLAIESLSMDLLRVALGFNRGSNKMAKKFLQEALKRRSEIQDSTVKHYFAKILDKLPAKLLNNDYEQVAEDALMYSVICKNYARKFA